MKRLESLVVCPTHRRADKVIAAKAGRAARVPMHKQLDLTWFHREARYPGGWVLSYFAVTSVTRISGYCRFHCAEMLSNARRKG
jgi:hypothetical protein